MMTIFNYQEKYKKYRVYRRYQGGWWDEWVLTESFDSEEEASERVRQNMESPNRPWFEEWKYEIYEPL